MTRRTLMLLGMLACIPPWGMALQPWCLAAQLVGVAVQVSGLVLMVYASFRED